MSNARKGTPKPPDAFQYCLKLLDSVDLCKKTSDVVLETMDKVSAELEPSKATRSIYKILEKVLEALAEQYRALLMLLSLELCHHCVMYSMYSALRARDKRKAICEELPIVPLKKACTSKPFKQLDNMINRNGKMPLPGVKTPLMQK
jgi:hypothetical protein